MKILDKTTQTYKELILKPGGDTLPIGSIVAFSGENIPNGWLLCDGSVVSRTTYSELFNAIGLNYVEDGVEWLDEERFPLPNAKGRTLVGKDSTDTDFNTLGKTAGEKTHTLTVNEMASHTHDVAIAVNNTVPGGARYFFNSAGTTSAPISDTAAWSNSLTAKATGGGQAHNNLQPSLTLNYIIKAKNIAVVKGEVIQENGTANENNTYSAKAIDNKLKTSIVTGQEVATNEYVDGKRVYVKRIEFTMPTTLNTWASIAQLDNTVDTIIYKELRFKVNYEEYDIPYSYNNEAIACYFNSNTKKLYINQNYEYPKAKSGWGILKYTKNT